MPLFYFLLSALLFSGTVYAGRGEWNEGYTSREQTVALRGMMALGVALHHMAQKTCAPWVPSQYRIRGLEPFLQTGYLFVGVFLFCSGLGLYRSLKARPDYLKGFFRRRILPIIFAYYLCTVLYTAVRLAMGERMNAVTVLCYLSGAYMANTSAWYLIAIIFFYITFWAAFRFCRRDSTAILWVSVIALGYAALGTVIDAHNGWWMQGEWWYNSIMLFPLGLLFGKYEARATAFLKKGYYLWAALAVAAAVLLFRQSEWINNHGWGYYGAPNDPMHVPHKLMSAGLQWLAGTAFVACCFLTTMKVRFGNAALNWLGGASLEFYLVHPLFVELFGFSFLDVAKSRFYIRSLPLYIAAVLACSVAAALLFGKGWRRLVRLAQGAGWKPRIAKTAKRQNTRRAVLRFTVVLLLLVLAWTFLGRDRHVRVMNGLVFRLPEHYARRYSDSRYGVWEYTGGDRRPGNLILDADIRDVRARNLGTAEEVLEACDWLMEAELYVNPRGVRMVRGYAEYSGNLERRYYIESQSTVMLMCMTEDERFNSKEDCEQILLEVADAVCPRP